MSEENYRYRILVDVNEFQQKVLDYISSDELDKMIGSTVFDGKSDCKVAIIHGITIASMLTSYCKPICIKERTEED